MTDSWDPNALDNLRRQTIYMSINQVEHHMYVEAQRAAKTAAETQRLPSDAIDPAQPVSATRAGAA